jgi:predicted HNH restriction endonuclease
VSPNDVRYREKKLNIISTYKASGCQICRWSGEKQVLDLHHIDPNNKVTDVSKIISSKGIKDLIEEIKKCIVLCANCHRLVHAGKILLKVNKRTKKVTFQSN